MAKENPNVVQMPTNGTAKKAGRPKKEGQPVEQPVEQNNVPDIQELMQMLSNLQAENKFLKSKLAEASEQIKMMAQSELHMKLDWLWRVITLEGSAEVFGDEFYEYCVNEFTEIMTPQPDNEKAVNPDR